MGLQGGTLTCRLKVLCIVSRPQVWRWWFYSHISANDFEKAKKGVRHGDM